MSERTQIADLLGEEGEPTDMTVVTAGGDLERLTLTIVAEFDAGRERVWDLWENPRKLERWWGPPACPATFSRHEFVVGGESRYRMAGPRGETPRGWWRIDAIEKPSRIEFANGLAGADGEPAPGVDPIPSWVTFETTTAGTRMTVVSSFVGVEQMERMLAMGMQDGMSQAIGQIDALL